MLSPRTIDRKNTSSWSTCHPLHFRPVDHNELVPRDHVLSIRKLSGEGILSEIKNVLGWIINTRLFKIFLHPDKCKLWISSIDQALTKNKKISEKEL